MSRSPPQVASRQDLPPASYIPSVLGVQREMSPLSPKCSLDLCPFRIWGLTLSEFPANQRGQCSGLSVSLRWAG